MVPLVKKYLQYVYQRALVSIYTSLLKTNKKKTNNQIKKLAKDMDSQVTEENAEKIFSNSVLPRAAVFKWSSKSFQEKHEIKTIFIIILCYLLFSLCWHLYWECTTVVEKKNLGSLSTNHGTGTNYIGGIVFFTTMHLELKTKFDEAVKIISCIISLPLSICLFIILCDKMRKAWMLSPGKAFVWLLKAPPVAYFIQYHFSWKNNW